MPFFDRYLIVDWSAANAPANGADSIWSALASHDKSRTEILNHHTRSAAMHYIDGCIRDSTEDGKRLLAGFDFAFGFPIGSDALPGGGSWEAVWEWLEREIEDDDENRSNRFEIGARLNALFGGVGPFWGYPHQHHGRYNGLGARRPDYKAIGVSERRFIDALVPRAQPVWKLAYTGSVGSQSLLGIARLEKLRRGPFGEHIAVWPFETGFANNLSKSVVLTEIYPSLFEVVCEEGEVKDSAQVRTLADGFMNMDDAGRLENMLDGPRRQPAGVREAAMTHEAWMAGCGDAPISLKASPERKTRKKFDYIRDPIEIYKQSFSAICAEAKLKCLPGTMPEIAIRLIHSCGMVDIIDVLTFSDDAAEAGQAALSDGAAVFCDVEMVRHAIIGSRLPAANEIVCTLNDDGVTDHAAEISNTRSAAAVDLWDERLESSVVAIGNAPTALFRLLERLEEGAPKPALIVGIPVGFVGAIESKQALAANSFGIPFITVQGRRGGSAMAGAVVNALAGGLS